MRRSKQPFFLSRKLVHLRRLASSHKSRLRLGCIFLKDYSVFCGCLEFERVVGIWGWGCYVGNQNRKHTLS